MKNNIDNIIEFVSYYTANSRYKRKNLDKSPKKNSIPLQFIKDKLNVIKTKDIINPTGRAKHIHTYWNKIRVEPKT